MLRAGKLCHRVACQFNGLEPHILMEAMGTVMFDIDLSECCVVSPSLSDSSSQCYQRLLENGSSVFCCWNTLSIRSIQCHHAPHASMIMFSSVCCPLAWVFMKNALRIALYRSRGTVTICSYEFSEPGTMTNLGNVHCRIPNPRRGYQWRL